MKHFFKLFFGFLFAGLVLFPAYATSSRMCYFQLTSASRSGASGDEAKGLKGTFKLGDSSDALISYFGAKKADQTESAFKAMVSDGKQCDALVLSGYHTGDFFPDNPERGSLVLKLIEKLSCQYENWFKNIKGIYLHGSRTVNDKYIEGVKKNPQSATLHKGDSDSITDKLVGNKGVTLEASDTVQTVNYSYAHTLDEHTPLSSRYMRAFPNAHIYGFSEDAGLGQGDEDIAKHIAKVLGALDADGKIKEEFKNTEKFVEALSKITADECDGGKWAGGGKEFVKKDEEKHKKARDLGCQLINAKQVLSGEKEGDKGEAKKSIKEALKEIAGDKNLSHLLINNITETLQFAEKEMDDEAFLSEMKGILKSGKFKTALKEKIDSPILPSLRKIDYIQLYKEFGGDTDEAVESLYERVTGASDQTTDNERTLYILMADKLSQYKLISQGQIEMIRKNGALFPDQGTKWQKDMKERLTYRSYAAQKKAGHDFIKSFEANVDNRNHIFVVADEILRNKDLQTAFYVTGRLVPENYQDELKPANEEFMFGLEYHIESMSTETRKKVVEEYLKVSKGANGDSNIKGKINFQANLLRALSRMDENEFIASFSKSKKNFFKELEDHQNLNEQLHDLLAGINDKLNNS